MGRILFFDVETDKAGVMFIVDGSEPVDNRWGVFPLVEVVFIRNAVVDAVKDLFANFAYFRFCWIDKSAWVGNHETGL